MFKIMPVTPKPIIKIDMTHELAVKLSIALDSTNLPDAELQHFAEILRAEVLNDYIDS